MQPEQESNRPLLLILIAGFALLVLLLVGSGITAIASIRSIELGADRLADEQRATIQLIDEVQREEGNLSSVFYALATGQEDAHRKELLARLDNLEAALRQTTKGGLASPESRAWQKVRESADAFTAEGRQTLLGHRPPTEAFYLLHQDLLDRLAELTQSSFSDREALQQREATHRAAQLRRSIVLLGIGLAVAMMSAIFTVWSVARMFRRQRWQAAELAQLSSRVMSDQEETARRLSHEMHDHFGQTLSAIDANLVAMKHMEAFQMDRMEDCLALVQDAVENVREVSQLLRPSILDDFGLDAGLRWLVEGFAERTGIKATYTSSWGDRPLAEIETQLFRITQEALTNVSRHSGATAVQVELAGNPTELRLSVTDNGRGLPQTNLRGGLGMTGMRARTRVAGGGMKIDSSPGKGVRISVGIPLGPVASAA